MFERLLGLARSMRGTERGTSGLMEIATGQKVQRRRNLGRHHRGARAIFGDRIPWRAAHFQERDMTDRDL